MMNDDDDDDDDDDESNDATEMKDQNGSTAVTTTISSNNKDGSEEVTLVYQEDYGETKSLASTTNNSDSKDTTLATTPTTTTLKFPALEKDGIPTFVMSDIRSLKRKPSFPPNPITGSAGERPQPKKAMVCNPAHSSSQTMVLAQAKRPTFCGIQANNNNSRFSSIKSTNTPKNSTNINKKLETQNRTMENKTSTSTNVISQQQQQQQQQNYSSDNKNKETKFGEMMVHELEKLPPILRIQAKNEITNVLFKYQLQHETQNMEAVQQ